TGYDESGPLLVSLLDADQSQAIQLADVSTLAHFNAPQLAGELTKRWAAFAPRVRSDVLAVLLSRPERALVLLQAIEGGAIQPSALTTAQVKFLRTHANAEVHDL